MMLRKGKAERDRTVPPKKVVGRARRRGGRGALWIVAAALATSGMLRLGSETGLAIASGVTGGEHGSRSDLPPVSGCETAEDIALVLELLSGREARVVAREDALEDRMRALTVAEEQVSRNLAALEDAEASLEATMALASTAAEEDLARLTSVYENMKPKEAAEVFAAMDPQFAAGFLGRMRADSAAAIMAGLDPADAYTISVLLAGRNADAPTE